MKKVFLKSALLTLAGIGLVAGNAVADPFNVRPFDNGLLVNLAGSQDSVQDILDDTFGSGVLDAITDQDSAAIWTKAEAAIDAYKVTSQNLSYSVGLGVYSYTTGEEVALTFNALGTAGFLFDVDNDLWVDGVEYEDFGSSFGFYTEDRGRTVYTEDSKNDGVQALSYKIADGTTGTYGEFSSTFSGDNDYLLAFESYVSPENGDFNDLVFIVEDMNPVPEPATMLLFGTGLIGLAGVARKRKMKK